MNAVFVEIYINKKANVNRGFLKELVVCVVNDELKKLSSRKEIWNYKGFSISLKIVSARFIRLMNKKYLNKDSYTDVITFSYMDEIFENQMNDFFHIGDILVSYEAALEWAKEHNSDYKKEFAFYVIHGILHSFDYDDSDTAERKKMFALQSYYMRKYNDIIEQF